MRLLSRCVLIGTSWPHGEPPEAETTKQIPDRTLGQLDPIALLDHLREIDPPPSHNSMLGQIRPFANKLRHRALLLGSELPLGSRSGSIMQSFQTFGVVAMHPVAQALSIHAAGGGCLAPGLAFQHQRQGQHPPGCRDIIASLGRRAKLLRRMVLPADPDRHHPSLLPNQEGKGIMIANRPESPTSHNSTPLV
jgi:hypothetical protein